MASKADFTADEWKSLISAMPMVGMAVAAASPSGPFGVVKEMMSVGMTIAEIVQKGSNNSLIAAVVDDIKARGTRPEAPAGISSPEQAKTAALAHLTNVGALVDGKASAEEAKQFKQWLLDLGQKVAEASNEGGFFGIGGVKVSDAEKAMLTNISTALKIG
jgi:hypothetical protein